jgi:hypothetical protein
VADFTTSKAGVGATIPENLVESAWDRYEPLVTPDRVKLLHLFGIPLRSRLKDPVTGKFAEMTPDDVVVFIQQAVSLAEAECGIDIFEGHYKEREAFDRQLFDSFGFMQLRHRPARSIERFTITSTDQKDIYLVPQDWIETGYLARGEFYIVPLAVSAVTGGQVFGSSAPSAGALYLSIWGSRSWIPAFWQTEYTTGFKDGRIPTIVNQLVGVIAAMEILSLLATTFGPAGTSASIGVDGFSQSQSLPGPQVYMQRLEELTAKRQWLVGRIKKLCGLGLFMTNV